MTLVTVDIAGSRVQLDIENELRAYDFNNALWRSNKLIASSPFRPDNSPSFYVNLNGDHAGVWGDSGAIDKTKGFITDLLGYLRGTNTEEAERYLLEKYGALYDVSQCDKLLVETPKLATGNNVETTYYDEVVTQAISPYLTMRGITEDAQKAYCTGYNGRVLGYTAMPWIDGLGRVVNVKYRSTKGKHFMYESSNKDNSEELFGAHLVKGSICVLCEAEIDAMSVYNKSSNTVGVATGHGGINRSQSDKVVRLGAKAVVIAGDNDGRGHLFTKQAIKLLEGSLPTYVLDWRMLRGYKDINEVVLADPYFVTRMEKYYKEINTKISVDLR